MGETTRECSGCCKWGCKIDARTFSPFLAASDQSHIALELNDRKENCLPFDVNLSSKMDRSFLIKRSVTSPEGHALSSC